jgi:hypothetical protein
VEGPAPTSAAARALQASGLTAVASLATPGTALAALQGVRAAVDETEVDGRLKATLLDRLDPERTVPARTIPRLLPPQPGPTISSARAAAATQTATTAADPLARTMLAPTFATPMYPALAALSPDDVLPGLGGIPTNAVVVLQPDNAFVAAFMVGLNGELARELVWRGIPVDRRATYFHHFWDFRGQAGGLQDIAPIASWNSEQSLADLGGTGDVLVLAVRGDLLRRYPRTIVQAVRAQRTANGGTDLADETAPGATLAPAFAGALPPDLRFFGFALPEAAARSSATDPGWFFVLQEPPTEARFGTESTPVSLIGTAADVAQAALRPPVRVAVHADDLLPVDP